MKQLLVTSGIVFFIAGTALAQEPAKASAKKTVPSLNVSTPQTESKEESEARLKAKKAHYDAMKAASAQPVQANDSKAARKPKSN